MHSHPSQHHSCTQHGDAESEANACPHAGEGKSEVAQVLRQIDVAYEAAKQGLTGLALGTARHDFINARIEQVAVCHEQLVAHVGEEEATRLIYDHYVHYIG